MFAQGGFQGPGRYQIRNVETQKPFDLAGDRLIQNGPTNSPSQSWDIQPAGPDVFYIRNAATGCALEFAQDRNGSPILCTRNNNPNQHWRFEEVGGGSALIISRFRKPIDIPDGTRRDGTVLQIYDRNGDGNQRFVFARVGIAPGGFSQDRREDRRDPDRFNPPGGFDSRGRYFDERDRMWKLRGDGVCFYRESDFRGEALCARSGEDIADVRRESPGMFLSLKFFGRARDVEIYERGAFRGEVLRLSRDESNLRRVRSPRGGSISEDIGSFRAN
jgi:hypothetical protein